MVYSPVSFYNIAEIGVPFLIQSNEEHFIYVMRLTADCLIAWSVRVDKN